MSVRRNNTSSSCSSFCWFGAWHVAAGICLVLCVSAVVPALAGADKPLTVQAAYYCVKIKEDPGSATVLLRNSGKEAVEIDSLSMDGSPLPAHGIGEGLKPEANGRIEAGGRLSAHRIIWAKLEPNPIPPGRSAELYIQFRNRPPYPFRLRMHCNGAVAAECKLFPVDNPIRITNIAFPQGFTKCYVYVKNDSDGSESIKKIEFNDTDVTGRTWVSARDIPPKSKELIVIPVSGLRAGDPARVLVTCQSGLSVVETVRAFCVLPVVLETGGPDRSIGLTQVIGNWPGKADPAREAFQGAACLRLWICPIHIMGSDWQGCSVELLRRQSLAKRLAPAIPTYIGVCRARAELGCSIFAHISDAGFINPYARRYSRRTPPDPADATFRGMQVVRSTSAPDPVFAMVAAYKFGNEKQDPSPHELRRLAYAVLACGARGIIYRLPQGRVPDRLTGCFRQVNDKISQLKPRLLICEPFDWAASSNEAVRAQALAAGREALLLFIMNCTRDKNRIIPASPAEITVDLPEWLNVTRVAPESDPIDGSVKIVGRKVHVKLNGLDSAAVIVFERHPDVAPRDSSAERRRKENGP